MVAQCSVDLDLLKVTKLDLSHLKEIIQLESLANHFPWSEAIIKQGLLADYHFMGIILHNELIAYAVLEWASVEVQLLNLGVAPRYQTQGIGRFLLQHLIQIAFEKPADKILLEVRVSNQTAINLYHSMGFKKTSTRQKYYQTDSVKEDAYLFERQL